MVKLTIKDTQEIVEAEQGVAVSDLFEFDGLRSVPFNCMRGSCGSCVVRPLSNIWHLGEMAFEERFKLESMDLSPNEHRLLCQCHLLDDSEVELV
ncbi:2Fe-2S iron-sulfur cluster-binding protein [Photobacterium rosenbergii]|uniref:2Fe-2S iron-sulfur cluster-binding protein n=1 Tax=Photobacterium rosenbergii TaxID=294936 RepID=A0ABU3ZI48_9GAMM|nr:2Fe-2S iron-sulfur cluster-binding protein [Photobacterium rosenbergii]MDV5169707.1 2Fe-2S iron-sulfur cluster-binding protein [Photobacterium rosenbergii]